MMQSVLHKVEDALSHLSTSTHSDKSTKTTADGTNFTNYLPVDELQLLHRWWSAANYLTIGQIYLQDNPLLRRPLTPNDIKPRLLGHWGTSPGLSLLYCHMNRLITQNSLNAIFPHRPRPRRPRPRRLHLPRGHIHRDLSRRIAQRSRPPPPLPPILHARRHPFARQHAHAWQHSRGRRAGLRAHSRVRGGVRQS